MTIRTTQAASTGNNTFFGGGDGSKAANMGGRHKDALMDVVDTLGILAHTHELMARKKGVVLCVCMHVLCECH